MALLRVSICLALVWAGLTRSSWAAAEPENAATYYRKAFALVPQAPADLEVYKDWTTVPLDDRALGVFQRGQQARQLLHQASQARTCDWEWDYNQGLNLQLPELRSMRPLVSAAPFWARVLFEQKHAAEGVDVVGDLLVLSRRFGAERMVVARLMARPVETSAWMAASPFLPDMPAEQCNRLADFVARLPTLPKVGNSMRSETGLITNELIDASKPNAPPDTALGDVPHDAQQAAALVRTIQELNREAARIAELPPDQADEQEPAFDQRLAAAPPLVAHVVLKSPNRLAHEARSQEMWAMFVAATQIAAKDESALVTAKDPITGVPFSYEKLPHGFRLVSSLKESGEAVSFVTGPEALK